MFKTGVRTIFSEIHTLTNSIWNKAELPEEWKESIILPIYKKGYKTDCSNYRHLSLLSNTYKILFNIPLSRLTPYAEELIRIINVGFDSTGQLLIIYYTFVRILKRNGNKMKQCIRYLWTSRKLIIHLGGRSCIIFSLSLIPP
jgi:hypothetical protein